MAGTEGSGKLAVVSPDISRVDACSQVDEWVKSHFENTLALSAEELTRLPVADAYAAWRLPHCGGYLILTLDRNFPYSEPRFIAEGLPELLGGPHIEDKGKICIAGDNGRVDSLQPIKVVEHSYQEVLALLSENQSGKNASDYQLDFGAYWRREAPEESALRTIIERQGPSRIIGTWSGKHRFVADDKKVLSHFLRNMKYDKDPQIGSGFAIWMQSLPDPIEYPKSMENLRSLVKNRSKDGLDILDKILTAPKLPIYGVFLGPTGDGRPPGVAGVRISEKHVLHRPGSKVQDQLHKGFRPGRVPPAILSQRLALTRLPVEAVDEAQTRRLSHLSKSLFSKTVCLVGCGSLGSGIAKLLLQSGVGKITLIDPDVLAWANVERHELGALSVGKNKAIALASVLQENFPFARIEGFQQDWRGAYDANADIFHKADLILSTCADWNAESALNDLQRTKVFQAPILYGWLEESALAGHALALTGEGPCMRCGFTATGGYLFSAVRAPNGIRMGCGGGISLYGATDMAPTQAMIAGVALDILLGKAKPLVHRVWLCPTPTLVAAEADWSPEWLATYGAPPPGGTIVPSQWPLKRGCICLS